MTDKVMKKKGTAQPVDKHVGQRLRTRRTLMGVSQEKLAEKVGITFQQIQKYERGVNRISSSRLYQFSIILNVPIDYFFEEIEKTSTARGMSDNDQDSFEGVKGGNSDIMGRKETIKLVREYYKLDSDKKRKNVMDLLKILNSEE